MTSASSSLDHPRNTPGKLDVVMRWVIRLLALVALCVSGYLAWTSIQGGDSLVGCGGESGFDCDDVLASPWSYFIGRPIKVPVSVPATGVYAAILLLSFLVDAKGLARNESILWGTLLLLVVMASGAALWFLALLATVLHKLCIFCLTVHACGLTLTALTILRLRRRLARSAGQGGKHRRNTQNVAGQLAVAMQTTPTAMTRRQTAGHIEPRACVIASCLGLMGVGLLITCQLLFRPPGLIAEEVDDFPDEDGPFVAVGADPDVTNPGNTVPARSISEPPTSVPPVSVSPLSNPGGQEPLDPALPVGIPGIPNDNDPSLNAPPQMPRGERMVPILKGRDSLNTYQHPIIGNPDAKYVVVKLFDYTCKHCRLLHRMLEQASESFGDDLAIVVLPVPLNTGCNPTIGFNHPDHQNACYHAKVVMSVWEADRARFAEFHNWMLDRDTTPSISEVANRAEQLVDKQTLERLHDSPEVLARLERYSDLLRRCRNGSLPKLLIGKWEISTRTQTLSVHELRTTLDQLLQKTFP